MKTDFSPGAAGRVPSHSLIAASRIIREMNQLPNPDLSGERAPFRRSSNHIFEWSLRPWWRAVLFLAPIVAVSAALAWKTNRVARAAFLANTVSVTDIQKALLEDPGNADLAHRLGVVYSTNPTDIDLPKSVKYLRQAVELNPRRWDFWSDLGKSCDFVGDTQCSDEAFERAW